LSEINFTYNVQVKLTDAILQALRMIGIKLRNVAAARADVPHLGFFVSLPRTPAPSPDYRKVLEQFKAALVNGPTINIHKMEKWPEVFRKGLALHQDFQGAESLRAIFAKLFFFGLANRVVAAFLTSLPRL
jgi:hypothetical protein